MGGETGSYVSAARTARPARRGGVPHGGSVGVKNKEDLFYVVAALECILMAGFGVCWRRGLFRRATEIDRGGALRRQLPGGIACRRRSSLYVGDKEMILVIRTKQRGDWMEDHLLAFASGTVISTCIVGAFSVLAVADSEMVYFVFFFRMFGLLLAVSYSTACFNRLDKTTATQVSQFECFRRTYASIFLIFFYLW